MAGGQQGSSPFGMGVQNPTNPTAATMPTAFGTPTGGMPSMANPLTGQANALAQLLAQNFTGGRHTPLPYGLRPQMPGAPVQSPLAPNALLSQSQQGPTGPDPNLKALLAQLTQSGRITQQDAENVLAQATNSPANAQDVIRQLSPLAGASSSAAPMNPLEWAQRMQMAGNLNPAGGNAALLQAQQNPGDAQGLLTLLLNQAALPTQAQ